MLNNLGSLLREAHQKGYAVGSFSPRYTKLIQPIIEAAVNMHSPVIVQISEKEITRHAVSLEAFGLEFFRVMDVLKPRVPVALHLDHTKTLAVIEEAMDCGFTSVMIDASELPFIENVARTKQIVDMASKRGISVEAELGMIGTTDFVETDTDEELYTDPVEAARFCEEAGVDCLAVSVGTAHGVYEVRKPKIDYERIAHINALTETPLVLHGGSGVPAEMVVRAVQMPQGGVSKVNIATDLELAMLSVIGRTGHLMESELNLYPAEILTQAQEAVRLLVEEKMRAFLLSKGRAG